MSIANLFVPNTDVLFCETLNAINLNVVNLDVQNLITNELTVTNTSDQINIGATNHQTILNAPAPSSNIILTLPTITETLIGTTDTATVSNKTFFDTSTRIVSTNNATKALGFNLTGQTGFTLVTIDTAATSSNVLTIPSVGVNNCNFQMGIANTIIASGSATYTPAQSGSTILVSQATSYAVSIPNPASTLIGCNYKFLVSQNGTNAVQITTVNTSGGFLYVSFVNAAGTFSTPAVGSNTITIVGNAAIIGDSIDCFCNGSVWVCSVRTNLVTGIISP